jgi:dTDP-4-dehydrorhamnose 3,5-epimerase
MKLTETALAGAFMVDIEPATDDRGFFARTFCGDDFAAQGLDPRCAQASICLNRLRGTVRGMHLQLPPVAEAKLVRCTRGAVLDVIIDLRPGSPTFLQHFRIELTGENHRALYVPPLFAHGYQVLADDSELHYQMSEPYTPGFERGIRYSDPALGIDWPLPVTMISAKDLAWPACRTGLLGELEALRVAG